MFGAIHKYFVTYQLPVIFVGSHHIGSDTLATGFGSERTYHIIGFVACHFQNGDAVGAYNILYNRYGLFSRQAGGPQDRAQIERVKEN